MNQLKMSKSNSRFYHFKNGLLADSIEMFQIKLLYFSLIIGSSKNKQFDQGSFIYVDVKVWESGYVASLILT